MKLTIFKRVISKGTYRPEIDGLRFIAIFAVLLFHIDGFLNLYTQEKSIFSSIWLTGDLGVPLFFSISGFVLMSQMVNADNFSYKRYFIRRIERIEPPFLITSLVFYFLLSFRDGFDTEKNYSLFRVLTYTSNFDNNLINVVTWSLEVEVVFYLLLPFMFLLLKKSVWKWLLLAFATLTFSQFVKIPFLTTFFHWFVIGIILAILEAKEKQKDMGNTIGKYLTIISLICFFALHHNGTLLTKVIQPLLLFLFLYGILIKGYFVRWLSFELFTIIGGACYIIYLIHFQVISVTGHLLISILPNRELLAMILLISTPIICLFAFPILERPFMKRKWWQFSKKIK